MLTLLFLILAGLPLGYYGARRFEAAVTFRPERAALRGAWRAPERGEDVWFRVASGARLHGWLVRAATRPATATVLYFHGNGGNLSYLDWLADRLSSRGFDVLLFDYRGYGQSEGDVSDERGIYEDADAAYDFLVKERGVRPASLVLYGQSLGTTAAVDVAARKPCGGVILESGLSSASDMAAAIFPVLPRFLRNLTRNKFDSVGKLPRVKCPVLVAHGDRDATIPVAQGRALFDAAPEPRQLIIVSGAGHNDLAIVGGTGYLDSLTKFITEATGENDG